MAEQCLVCQFDLKDGDDVVQLRDENGHIWFVHAACQDGLEHADEPPTA